MVVVLWLAVALTGFSQSAVHKKLNNLS